MAEKSSSSVANFRMTKAMAKRKINAASRLTENVIVNEEIYAWGARYAIFDIHLFEILRHGDPLDEPVRNEHGDWECTMTHRLRGRPQAYALTIILCEGSDRGRLYLKSVSWEVPS